MLFYSAFPFFHLRVQSSFNKACFLLRRHYPPLHNLPEQEDHRKAIVGNEETDVTYNMLPENKG